MFDDVAGFLDVICLQRALNTLIYGGPHAPVAVVEQAKSILKRSNEQIANAGFVVLDFYLAHRKSRKEDLSVMYFNDKTDQMKNLDVSLYRI